MKNAVTSSANLPNLLTLARLAALPVVVVLARTGWPLAATTLFVAVMLSDCADGWLARRLRQCTPLGVYLDPVVDKIVLLALLYELAWAGALPATVAHLFLARELLQSAVRSSAASQGATVGANWMGKTKATLQTILVAWGLALPSAALWLPAPWPAELARGLRAAAWAVVVLTWGFFGVFAWWNRRFLLGSER